jgi:hypothetical protein
LQSARHWGRHLESWWENGYFVRGERRIVISV